MDLTIFTTPEAWISLITLIFLEIVLGVDNLVFIAITTSRLPEEKQHIGRRLGLAGALIMRIVFLSFASFLIHLTDPLFQIELGSLSHGFSIRDLVLLLGGVYLIYKGIVELRDVLRLSEIKAEYSHEHKKLHQILLPQAVVTIMIMDLVFSIDSVITAVGLADHLIIMIIAVMLAVFMMMIFIDPISEFIDRHPEMKILALTFIIAIGGLLALESMGIHTGFELLGIAAEKVMVYFAMIFAIILELIQMAFNKNYGEWRTTIWEEETRARVGAVCKEMTEKLEAERAAAQIAKEKGGASFIPQLGGEGRITPVFVGNNVYVMMPVEGQDAKTFRQIMERDSNDEAKAKTLNEPIEIIIEDVDESPSTTEETNDDTATDN